MSQYTEQTLFVKPDYSIEWPKQILVGNTYFTWFKNTNNEYHSLDFGHDFVKLFKRLGVEWPNPHNIEALIPE